MGGRRMSFAGAFRGVAGALALHLLLACPAGAACRLALVLAVDVSRSVDQRDYAIQKGGILAALADPAVIRAFLDPTDPVSLALFEWSRNTHQFVVIDWTMVRSEADLLAISARLEAHTRMPFAGTTALGEALRFAGAMLNRAPDCTERVIDVSGDGSNNSGASPAIIYSDPGFPADRVNGLAIQAHERSIAEYYRDTLIHGPGAFVEIAEDPNDFPRAFRKKLIRELTEQLMGDVAAGLDPKG